MISQEKLNEIVAKKDTQALTFTDAVQMAEELYRRPQAEKSPLKVLSAEDVEEEGWYWSVDNEEFVQIDCDPTILPWQLSMWIVGSSVCSRLQGQFIGPIQMPEV